MTIQPQEELDLESYILQEEADAAEEADEAEVAEVAVVEENETETIETVKQVLHRKGNLFSSSTLILNTGEQRAVTGKQPAEGGDGSVEGADEDIDADPEPGVEGPLPNLAIGLRFFVVMLIIKPLNEI